MNHNPRPNLPSHFRLDELRIDCPDRRVIRDDSALEVSGLTFDLLIALAAAKARGQGVATFDYLLKTVWPGQVVSDDTLTQRVKLLRKALGDRSDTPRYIESVRAVGYRLIPDIGTISPKKKFANSEVPVLAFEALVLALLIGFGWWYASDKKTVDVVSAKEQDSVAAIDPFQSFLTRAKTHLSQHQREDQQIAMQLYQRVLDAEPENVQARIGKSIALSQGVTKFGAPVADLDQAEALANSVIASRPDLARAHVARAYALDALGEVEAAVAAYERALLLKPDQPGVRGSLAYLLQVSGQLARALKQNVALIPHSNTLPYLDIQLGTLLYFLGLDEPGLQWLERADLTRPGNAFAAPTRASTLIALDRDSEAQAVLDSASEQGLDRPEVAYLSGVIAWRAGQKEAARTLFAKHARDTQRSHMPSKVKLAILNQNRTQLEKLVTSIKTAESGGDTWPTNPLMRAELLSALGETEQALDALAQAVSGGYRDQRMILADPAFADLRTKPEFESVMNDLARRLEEERAIVLASEWISRLPGVMPESETP